MDSVMSHRLLGQLLQRAYSGELAAAYAYRGHWKSLTDKDEIAKIQRIEEEEWVHRRNIRRMLWFLDFCPSRAREGKSWIIGRCIGVGCHLAGWFWPMYFAGRLESANTKEYETAASYARDLGLAEFEGELLNMSAVEKEHELYFLGIVTSHRLLPFAAKTFKWGRAELETKGSVRGLRSTTKG
jgi:rubrerythrin